MEIRYLLNKKKVILKELNELFILEKVHGIKFKTLYAKINGGFSEAFFNKVLRLMRLNHTSKIRPIKQNIKRLSNELIVINIKLNKHR